MRHTLPIGGNIRMSMTAKVLIIFLFGGVGYGLIEILWRGRTHPSMVLTGGACFAIIWGINYLWQERSIFLRCAVAALLITAVEFCVGMLVNRLWQMDVWDYSGEKFNLFGQICPKYTILWFILSLPLSIAVSRVIKTSRF